MTDELYWRLVDRLLAYAFAVGNYHKTTPIQIWVDVDEGIAEMVTYLNTIPGVRTHASCQGTIGEGGPAPYRAQVMATWTNEAFERLKSEFDVTIEGKNWGYLHPRTTGGSRPSDRTAPPPLDTTPATARRPRSLDIDARQLP